MKMEINRLEALESLDQALRDRMIERRCRDWDDTARKKPWRISRAYSFSHASSNVWMWRIWEVQAKFSGSIYAFAWVVDLEWAQEQLDSEDPAWRLDVHNRLGSGCPPAMI